MRNAWRSVDRCAKSWHSTKRCQCSLSIKPLPPLKPIKGLDITLIVHRAHQLNDFARAHDDFEMTKEEWTPAMLGRVIQMISEAKCTALDAPFRIFHKAIRNNDLWAAWIGVAAPYTRFEKILLQELGDVIENLSPRYVKDIKIDHLLEVFASHGETVRGRRGKLKRQVVKWCETQPDEILNKEWSKINVLKWRIQEIIDKRDLEKQQLAKRSSPDWRFSNDVMTSADSNCMINKLRANWNAFPGDNRIVLG